MIKNILKKIYFLIKKYSLKKQNVIIESNVSFFKTIFTKYNRICANSHIDNSTIGQFSYVGWNSILRNVEIGSFCSIAPLHPITQVIPEIKSFSEVLATTLSFTAVTGIAITSGSGALHAVNAAKTESVRTKFFIAINFTTKLRPHWFTMVSFITNLHHV